MSDPACIDLISAQLAARGFYVELRYMRDSSYPKAAKRFLWVCDLNNEILGQFPRGQGESALLAVERARASLSHIEEIRRGTP